MVRTPLIPFAGLFPPPANPLGGCCVVVALGVLTGAGAGLLGKAVRVSAGAGAGVAAGAGLGVGVGVAAGAGLGLSLSPIIEAPPEKLGFGGCAGVPLEFAPAIRSRMESEPFPN